MKTLGIRIDETYTPEDFTGHLGELLADYDGGIPRHIRIFLQGLYQIAYETMTTDAE